MCHMKRRIPVVIFLILFLCFACLDFAEEEIQYIPKHGDLKCTYGQHEPVMKIKAGTVIVSSAEVCRDGKVQNPEDPPSKVMPLWHDNPLTGPFYIQGAEPGDPLAVHIHRIEPALSYGVSGYVPGFGAITGTEVTAILESPLPELV